MYEIVLFLKETGIKIHSLSLLIIIELILKKKKKRKSTVGHVLSEAAKVSAGVEI